MRVKIDSDGTVSGTKVVDKDTDEIVICDSISFHWSTSSDNLVMELRKLNVIKKDKIFTEIGPSEIIEITDCDLTLRSNDDQKAHSSEV